MRSDMDALGQLVAMAVKSAMAPMSERLALAEAKLVQHAAAEQTIAELRERVVVAETKAALLRPDSDFDAVLIRVAAIESRQAAEHQPALVSPPMASVPAVSLDDLTALRDRLEFVEAKAAGFDMRMVSPEPLSATAEKAQRALADTEKNERALADLTKDIGALRERIAVAEVRAPIPGPSGKDGKDGADGMGWDDLVVEHDGERSFKVKMIKGDRVKEAGSFKAPTMIYRGVLRDGRTYEPGDMVTYGGSLYHCQKTTALKPDTRPAQDGAGGFIGPNGKDFWTMVVKHGEKGKDGVIPASDPGLPVVRVR